MKLLVILVAAFLVSQSAHGDCPAQSENVRLCYDNDNAPPELLYKMFIENMFADSLDDQEQRMGWYYLKGGLTQKMNHADVYSYFIPKFLEIQKEVEEVQNRMLCLDGKPRYDGEENFGIFNAMDDVKLAIYEKHWLVAKSDLSVNGLFDLDKAMRESSGGFTSLWTDHKASRNRSVKGSYETAEKLCAGPREYNFGSYYAPMPDQE